jgi:predicted RNase H-like nuclease (RuvC/YqgF family)
MIKNTRLICISTLVFSLFASPVLADIYKHMDANGVVTYSNLKSTGAIKLNIANDGDSSNTSEQTEPGNSRSKPRQSGSDFPRVDTNTQIQRDAKRQSILEAELKAEKAALSLAKEAYALEAAKPEIARQKNSDGTVSTYRNMAKFNEKMKPLQAELDNHQNNIELLQKELNNIR